MKQFAKWFQAINAAYVIQRNFEIIGVRVAILDISHGILSINVFPAIYNMHGFYRNIFSPKLIMPVKYWQTYEGNAAVQ